MHLCICASFSNLLVGSLAMFMRDLRASIGQRNFASGRRVSRHCLAPATAIRRYQDAKIAGSCKMNRVGRENQRSLH
jgi:hypothetical protein